MALVEVASECLKPKDYWSSCYLVAEAVALKKASEMHYLSENVNMDLEVLDCNFDHSHNNY